MKLSVLLFSGCLIFQHPLCAQDCEQAVRQLDGWLSDSAYSRVVEMGEKYRKTCCDVSPALCIQLMNPLSQAYYQQLEIPKCIEVHEVLIEKYQALGWEEKQEFLNLQASLSVLYNAAGEYGDSYRYSRKAMDKALRENAGRGVLLSKLNLIVSNMAMNIPAAGDHFFGELFKLVEQPPANPTPFSHLHHYTVKSVWASYLANTGQAGAAIELCERTTREMDQEQESPFLNLARVTLSLSYALAHLNVDPANPERAVELASETLRKVDDPSIIIFMKSLKLEAALKGGLHLLIGKAHLLRGDIAQAKAHHLLSLRFFEEDGSALIRSGEARRGLAQIYSQEGQVDSALHYFRILFADQHQKLDDVMDVLSVQEKEALVFNNEELANLYWAFASRYITSRPELSIPADEPELYRRRIVFDEWKKVLELARQQENGHIESLLVKWEAARRKIAYRQALMVDRALMSPDVDSLHRQVAVLERQLSDASPMFRRQRATVGFEQVRSALDSRGAEAVVEFLEYMPFEKGRPQLEKSQYAALVIRRNWDYPTFVPLFEGAQLDSLLRYYESRYTSPHLAGRKANRFYADPALHEMIWSKVDPHLTGVETVYYAPAGALHKIAFAALRQPGALPLAAKYDMRCITSGRELVPTHRRGRLPSMTSILAFGDIDYGEACYEKPLEGEEYGFLQLAEASVLSGKVRNQFGPLKKTAAELSHIKRMAEGSGLEFNQYRGCAASESRFKSLGASVPTPSILHLATHGFFAEDTTSHSERFSFPLNPLFRSGLAFAGANDSSSSVREDGKLTAYDVAHMNLDGVALAVLSACETGLGDIRNSEGVYGLQRAFKMAGAEYLLLSLWPVQEQPTLEFMTAFYQRLLDGATTPKAYVESLRYMRKRYPGEPYKWAAFVLL